MESSLVWIVTVAVLVAVIAFDFMVVVRKPHEPTFAESLRWTGFYVGLACVFGFSMFFWNSAQSATEFFAGYVTEWSLSVDNLFVFLVILTRFAVPPRQRQRVLLIGVVLALVLRAAFILAGAAALSAFSWAFYVFGAFLLWTAVSLAREGGSPAHEDQEYHENRLVRAVRSIVPVTDDYRGGRFMIREQGRRFATPLLIVIIAIGTTDVLFALDSIPAIFGLTQDPYIVFTANACALMGLRQLFFVVQGLLTRLIYLSYGLAAVLAFIGLKLVVEALHRNALPFINGGEPVEWAPHIPTWLSLLVIVVCVGSAAIASVVATRGSRAAAPAPDAAAGSAPDEPSA